MMNKLDNVLRNVLKIECGVVFSIAMAGLGIAAVKTIHEYVHLSRVRNNLISKLEPEA